MNALPNEPVPPVTRMLEFLRMDTQRLPLQPDQLMIECKGDDTVGGWSGRDEEGLG
jgi:hypothetical protein